MERRCQYLTVKQIAALHREAKRTGLSAAEIVRRAIDAYLTRKDSR